MILVYWLVWGLLWMLVSLSQSMGCIWLHTASIRCISSFWAQIMCTNIQPSLCNHCKSIVFKKFTQRCSKFQVSFYLAGNQQLADDSIDQWRLLSGKRGSCVFTIRLESYLPLALVCDRACFFLSMISENSIPIATDLVDGVTMCGNYSTVGSVPWHHQYMYC